MSPLTKQTGTANGRRFWRYQINGDFYALNFNPSATLHHVEGKDYVVTIGYRDRIVREEFESFREAFNYLVKNTVARYYRNMPDPRVPTREEMYEMQKLK